MLALALLTTLAFPPSSPAPPIANAQIPPEALGEPDDAAPKRLRDRMDPEVDARVQAVCRDAARHLVRVRVFGTQEIRDWTGNVVARTETEFGYCHGLVLTHEPLIAVSPSSCRVDQSGMANFPVRKKPPGASGRQYQVLLDDGTRLDAVVAHEDVAINLHFLRLVDVDEVPQELRSPLPIRDIRRLRPSERYGAPVFANIFHNNSTAEMLGIMDPGKVDFPRPALRAVGLPHLGVPIYAEDGSLIGIANLPPPEEGVPEVRVDPRNNDAPPGKDPTEWNTGLRRPLLFPGIELIPKIEMLVAEYEAPISFSPLGVTVRNRGDQVIVDSVDEGADTSLIVGDRLLSIAGHPVRSVDGFIAAFETAMEEEDMPTLRISRGDEEIDVEIHLGG